MEMNEDSPKSVGVCEKILNAVSGRPACKKTRTFFHPQHDAMPVSPAPNPSLPTHNHVGEPVYIQIESAPHEHHRFAGMSQWFHGAQQEKRKLKKQNHGQKEGKQRALRSNDTFTEYINRAKMKIRTVSNVGGETNEPRQDDARDTKKKDTAKDHFAEYIHRVKMKIRTTSFAPGKIMSFKRE